MEIQEASLTWRTIVFILAAVILLFIFQKTRAFYSKLLDFSVLKRLNTYIVIVLALLFIFISNLFINNKSLSTTYNLLTSSYSSTIMLDTYQLVLFIINFWYPSLKSCYLELPFQFGQINFLVTSLFY